MSEELKQTRARATMLVKHFLREELAELEEALAAAKEASGNQAKEFHEQREVWQGELFESERRAEEAAREKAQLQIRSF